MKPRRTKNTTKWPLVGAETGGKGREAGRKSKMAKNLHKGPKGSHDRKRRGRLPNAP